MITSKSTGTQRKNENYSKYTHKLYSNCNLLYKKKSNHSQTLFKHFKNSAQNQLKNCSKHTQTFSKHTQQFAPNQLTFGPASDTPYTYCLAGRSSSLSGGAPLSLAGASRDGGLDSSDSAGELSNCGGGAGMNSRGGVTVQGDSSS